MYSAIFLSVIILGCVAATNNMSCVSEPVCLVPASNTTTTSCPVDLVNCDQVDPCLRTTEFWTSHMAEWPITTGAFCFHTWQDIVLQDPVSQHGNIFPTECHALAVITITLILDDKVGAIRNGSAVMSILDAAQLEIAACCTDPVHSDTNSIHHLFSYLSGIYTMNQGNSTDLMPLCTLSPPEPASLFATLTTEQYITIGCLLASMIIITFFSISTCIHYNILCRVWNDPRTVKKEYRDRAYYMILSEKFSLYSMLDIGNSADYVDEYSTEELEKSQFASTLNDLDQTIVQIHKKQMGLETGHKDRKNIVYI